MFTAGVKVGDYVIVRGPLGHGSSFGDVYVAEDSTGTLPPSAIKINKDNNLDSVQRFYRENEVLHALKPHDGIVQPYTGVLVDPLTNREYYCMELGDMGIADYIVANPTLPASNLVSIFRQVCLALKYAHAKSVVHRDLHDGNLLVFGSSNNDIMIKVTDFGWAKHFDGSAQAYDAGAVWGRHDTYAPEIFFKVWTDVSQSSYALSSDIYSLGIILALLFGVDISTYLSNRQLSIAQFFLANQIGTMQGVSLFNLNIYETIPVDERRDWFSQWSDGFDYDALVQSMYPLTADEDINKVLKKIIYGCCTPDYNSRFGSVDDILKEMDGLC